MNCPHCDKPMRTARSLPIHRALVHGIRRKGIDDRFAPLRSRRTIYPLTETEVLLLDHIDELEAELDIQP